ncbi:FKBP-type peptidyl-prolyl cis-trans isomerase [Novosphingobium sp. MMS21-SN21R]|uniref:FKBP-type peptidyl-prolyl cis-trans isomerase n=1 Tax=Novosphingobium sp. MMS21-SN21R TaxID=2969298 RepID=UPI002886203D|nr:FKBP-type peptidyl-prolyl cis-trans isomerase [Novosphingobium sp. MMS21-SN21R]MDT0508911.1 FKBP-type peptidyl-prolyl cis-trans isomerase [Novosphingobium sp. MMS21-SN21R]
MTISPMALCRIAPLLALAAGVPVSAATPAKVAKPPVPSAQAIPLPLNPIVSAGQRLCSATVPSGLGTMLLNPAEGAKPAKADFVLVNYIGYLTATGAVFDQGMQAAFPVEGVIPGFSEGLQMMTKGSTWRFCVPAALGYGDQVSGPIPANSDLVFQVELVDFKTSAEVEAMRAAQGAQQGQQ